MLLSIFLLSNCQNTSAKGSPKVHKVEIKGMNFQPAVINVQKGDTVIWTNMDIVAHDATEETKKEWSSSPIPNGKSWKMAVQKSANYFCSIHPVMKGKIVVK